VPHQAARRQQFNSRVRIRLLARQRIFAKLGDVAYGRSLLFQKQRSRCAPSYASSIASAEIKEPAAKASRQASGRFEKGT
jgi:hypothetical protein